MQKYSDVVLGQRGNFMLPVPNAQVTVLNSPSNTVATIYSDNGITVTTNPLSTDATGRFSFYAANGRYSIIVVFGTVTVTLNDIVLEDDPENSQSYVVTGGSIDGTPIGSITPSTGVFTNLTVSGTSPFVKTTDLASPIAGLGAGLVGFQQTGTGAVGRTAQAKLYESVSVEDYGAVGDGITDDTNAINLADASLTIGGTLNFGFGKKYATNGACNISHAGVINGNGSTIVLTGAGLVTGLPAMTIGFVIQDITLGSTVAVTANSDQFNIPVGISMQAGDLVEFRSSDVRVVASPDNYNNGMYAIVESVSGSVATLASVFYGSFNVNRVRIRRPPASTVVRNLIFDVTNSISSNTVGTTGLAISAKNYLVTGCKAFGNDYAGQAFICEGDGGIIEDCEADHFLNIQGLPLPGRVGYGVLFTGNRLQARNCVSKYCKHGFTTGSRDIVSSQLSFIDNKVFEDQVNVATTYGGSIDSHANVSDTVYIRGNTIYSRMASLSIRNGLAICEANQIYQLPGNTFQVLSAFEVPPVSIKIRNNFIGMNSGARIFDQMQTSSTSITIEDNRISGGTIILTTASTPTTTAELIIQRNRHINCDRFVQLKMSNTSPFGSFTKLVLKDNVVVASVSASNANLLEILSDTAGAKNCTVDDVIIQGNDIDMSPRGGATTGYAISVSDCTFSNARIFDNRIKRQDGITYSQRGFSFLRVDTINMFIERNICDSGIAFTNATTPMNIRCVIQDNDFETLNFNDNDSANPMKLVDVKIIHNTIHNLQALTPVVFASVSGSTAWSDGFPVWVQYNVIQSSAPNSVSANANTVGNKIYVTHNNLSGIYTDSTNAYAFGPFLNVTGAAQPYKGTTTINYSEILKNSIPTTGTWAVGDRVRNGTPVVGQPKAWSCTVAGTPGTWVSEGNL